MTAIPALGELVDRHARVVLPEPGMEQVELLDLGRLVRRCATNGLVELLGRVGAVRGARGHRPAANAMAVL